MKVYSCKDAPLQVFGVPFFYEKQNFQRLPAELRDLLGGSMEALGSRCPGARIGFRTDAAEFTVSFKLKSIKPDVGMSIFSCQAINVMVGERQSARLLGLVNPPNYETLSAEKTFYKSGEMEEVTLWLPRNEEVEEVTVSFPDNATVEAPTPYRHGKVLFYGSSITEGGCCCNNTNNYIALLSRWLDMDFYNFGFSGSARGELAMADYINGMDMRAFVLDYDHNAPSVEHLQKTHEPFFKRIREKHPNMPILMLSRPDFDRDPAGAASCRAVIRATYENALAAGDRNVYFVDGETFFGKKDRQLCTIDTVHPNDLGFYRMAEAILPTMQAILDSLS